MSIDGVGRLSPHFIADLGAVLEDDAVVLPGLDHTLFRGVVHGGAVAALALMAADPEPRSDRQSPAQPLAINVDYITAARRPPLRADVVERTDRRTVSFINTQVLDGGGVVARAAVVRGLPGHLRAGTRRPPPLSGPGDVFNSAVRSVPYLRRRNIAVNGASDDELSLVLPCDAGNQDDDGHMHYGALLTLVDAAGTTVPWVKPRDAGLGATVSLSVQFYGRPGQGPVRPR